MKNQFTLKFNKILSSLTLNDDFGWGELTIQPSTPKPFNSHKRPRQNFSLQYQYNICKQKSDENKDKYQLGDYKLIQYQILWTNIMRTV